MDLISQLTQDMKAAMKAGNKDRLAVVRMVLNEAKVADLSKKTPDQAVSAYAKKLAKSIEEYQKYGKSEEARQLQAELAIVQEYLPQKASAEHTEKLVDEFLAANTFTSQQIGQAMGAFMKVHGQQVDAAVANQLLRQKLAGK